MNDELKLLDDLPRIEPSRDFQAMLLQDAIGQLPAHESVALPRKTASIWMSFAMAASLAIGVWMGLGQAGAMQDALGGFGLGVTQSASSDIMTIDIYDDSLIDLGL